MIAMLSRNMCAGVHTELTNLGTGKHSMIPAVSPGRSRNADGHVACLLVAERKRTEVRFEDAGGR